MRVWKIHHPDINANFGEETDTGKFLTDYYNTTIIEIEPVLQFVTVDYNIALRFALSEALPEYPIGSFNTAQIVNGIMYLDPKRLATYLTGETVVVTKDVLVASLFVKCSQEKMDYLDGVPIIYRSIVNILQSMGVNAIVSYNDIVIPKADGKNYKLGCGFLKAQKVRNGVFYNRESAVITFKYDESIFSAILSHNELTRENSRDEKSGGITGIEDEYPDFDRVEFQKLFIEEVRRMVD